MTPKEKAKELLDKYQSEKIITFQRSSSSPIEAFELTDSEAKYCALIAVDEIIKLLPNINNTPPARRDSEHRYFQYWISVKNELNKM